MIDVRDDLATALAGRYDIERELGHGGMAIVYLARDVRHGRHVAVKALRPELATTLGAERFLREINIAARLTHPNILALHDSGEAAGMLYFVMPHVEGETLRERLEREHQLPMEEALSITRQVGLALDYAHERGIVHRDIKPENILLLGDHVLVADFGLARALHTAGTQRLTESAVAVGTPAYMSPEQAAADPDVDGRADLYSLACVLFEMVAGMPPFKGANSAAVLAQHLTAKPPSICAQRPHCPPNVDTAVARALEKTPADRFRTAGEFVAAMTVGGPTTLSPVPPDTMRFPTRRPSRRALILSAIGVGLVVVAGLAGKVMARSHAAASLDQDGFVVLPLTAVDAAARTDTAIVARAVADALGEWDGVHVVGSREMASELAGIDHGRPITTVEALALGARLGVANVVWGEVSATPQDGGSGMTVRLSRYDVSTGTVLRSTTLDYARGTSGAVARAAANALLRGDRLPPIFGRGDAARPSLTAWIAYDSGRTLLDQWDITDAARQFRAALRADPAHAEANLWLSLSEMWAATSPDRWRGAARQAYDHRARLRSSDTLLAAGQLALAEGRYPDACTAYRRVVATDSTGVIGWYGLGECQSRDSLVVHDAASPSGWSFRGSMEQAVRAYMHVVDERAIAPPTFVFSRLSQLLYTSGIQLRPGHSSGPERVEFGAFPSLARDTLGFVPYRLDDPRMSVDRRASEARARALDRNRALLRRLYRSWAATAPATVEAHTALAGLLETLDEIGSEEPNELSALWQLHRARTLSSEPAERRRLAKDEIRLLVKAGNWTGAASLVDSVLADAGDPAADTTGVLAGPAALTGRIRTLAAILRAPGGVTRSGLTLPNGTPLDASPALEQEAANAFAWAMMGACGDTVVGYRARIDRQIASYVPDPKRRDAVRGALLRRPLALAAPCVGTEALVQIDPAGDKMVMLEQAIARHDTPAFRAIFDGLVAARTLNRPGDTALDYTFVESWLFTSIGDTAAAARHLDASLDALPTLGAFLLDYPSHSAAFVRAMGLRAEIAAASGDRATAARWARPVTVLWAHGDPEVQPYVRRMCELVPGCHSAPAKSASR
ncbi:MAG: protein kinase domain-containing protein [Gemmatimonadaceae bacterium]